MPVSGVGLWFSRSATLTKVSEMEKYEKIEVFDDAVCSVLTIRNVVKPLLPSNPHPILIALKKLEVLLDAQIHHLEGA